MIIPKNYNKINFKKYIEYDVNSDESIRAFLEKHKLIDLRKGIQKITYYIS